MASIEFVVNATDAASGVFAKIAASADGLDKQLKDLDKRIATPEVDLEDAKFTQGLIRAAERLDKLSAKVADPKIEVDGAKAQEEILRINAMLDRLDAKRVSPKVDIDRSFLSRLGGLFGGGAGGEAGGGLLGLVRGLPGVAGAAPVSAQAIAFGGLAGLAAVLAPALLPLGLGGLAGGGAGAGAFALGSAANKQMQALAKQLQSPSLKRGQRQDIRAQMAALRQQSGPELAIFGAFQDLGGSLKDVFAGALKSTGQGFSGAGPNQSFLTSLAGILKQIGGFVKSIGPELGQMFRASIPFLQMFVGFLEKAAKALLPAFTQMLQEMAPFLPVISAGLMNIVKGLVGFLNAIGPSGMKASARIFVVLTEGMAAALVAFGHTINWLTENVPKWARFIVNEWKTLRHETAVIFDGVRHDIAHVWDMIFENSIGMVIRLAHNVETQYNSLRHGIASTFDTIRHDTASAWDAIWNNTVGRARRGIDDVIRWFQSLPGRAIRALEGLGTSLYNFAHMALTKFWNGLKAVFNDVWGWFKSLPGKLLHAIGIASPPDWAIEAGKHIMGGLLHGITSRKDELLSRMQAISAGMGSVAAGKAGVAGALGGDAAANERLARSMFPWPSSMWPAFRSLEMREAGFNRFARNPSSGAYGIPQALPPTKMPFAAQAAGGSHAGAQLSWMFSYIAARYGNPVNAWAHEVSAGWYDRGGWLPPGLSLALNTTGAPERVGGGGNTYQITVNVPPSANKADVGRAAVEAIVEFEKRSGSGWRR